LKKAKSSNLLTIIGSGLAGFTLVREIRKLDKDFPIRVITQDSGDYYSKPQLSTAFTHHKSPSQLVLIPAEKFARQFNIEIKPYTKIEEINFSYDQLVFACGARPVIPLFEKGASEGIYSVNNLDDYTPFHKSLEDKNHVTIVGAGLVGCEFANDLIHGGYEVTIIAPENYPLSRLVPEEIGIELKKALEEKGVHWRLGEFFDSEENHEIVLSAIGLKPEIALAQFSGIKVNKGIIVDEYLQTSQSNIYALGDCAEFKGRLLPYIAPIAIGARALAKTILGERTPVIYPPMPIYIKTPAYPIVVLQPEDDGGEWHLEKTHNNIRALVYNKNNELKGFALGGESTMEAVEWIKRI
jgi:rubredoxin-NAD+ reductase